MRGLDLFCGAGGCSVGYSRAGIEMVGVDHIAQPRYPFSFQQGDALEYLRILIKGGEIPYDFIHASPPCQGYSKTWHLAGKTGQRELISATRKLLRATGKPYIIENVLGAPLRDPIILCGSSFSLPLRRHRQFESNFPLVGLDCRHNDLPMDYITRSNGRTIPTRFVYVYAHQQPGQTMDDWREAMGIDWMIRPEMAQAIPPAYTEFLGKQVLALQEGIAA